MSESTDSLILDLCEWVASTPRNYAETMDAWRTSCPRLTVWEDAVDRGYVERQERNGETFVVITEKGRRLLAEHLRQIAGASST